MAIAEDGGKIERLIDAEVSALAHGGMVAIEIVEANFGAFEGILHHNLLLGSSRAVSCCTERGVMFLDKLQDLFYSVLGCCPKSKESECQY